MFILRKIFQKKLRRYENHRNFASSKRTRGSYTTFG